MTKINAYTTEAAKYETLQHYAAQKARLEKIKANLEKEIEYFAQKVVATTAEDPKDRFWRRVTQAHKLEADGDPYRAYWELRIALEQYSEYNDIF